MQINIEDEVSRAYPRHPSPVDRYVGSRIRLRRTLSGASQDQLASMLGITFQQVQKYENGANRVGASRLYEISCALNVPVAYFFAEMPSEISKGPFCGTCGETNESITLTEALNLPVDDHLMRRETLALVRGYFGITALPTRKRILELINTLGAPEIDGAS